LFAGGIRTAAVFTSDGDWSTPEQFEELSESLLENNATASFYLMKDTKLSEDIVRQYREKGHAFAPHVNPNNTEDEWYFDFPETLKEETALFKQRFGETCSSLQCHWAPWQGYMNWVRDFADNGYRMLMAYLSLLPERIQINDYMCGSGRPMKFVTLDGKTHDTWQQPVFICDDGSIKERLKNDIEKLKSEFDNLLKSSLEEHHSSFGFLSHPCSFSNYSRPYMEYCLEQMKNNGVPVYNGTEWCKINDERYGIQISGVTISENQLKYTFSNLPSGGFSFMIPSGKGLSSVSVNGEAVDIVIKKRLGVEYLFIDITDSKEAVLHIEVVLDKQEE